MRCPEVTELLAGSAMATAFLRSDNASAKPRCSGSVLWPPRYLAALRVRSLLQPLLSKETIFGFPARKPHSARQSFGDNSFSFHLPAGSPAISSVGRDSCLAFPCLTAPSSPVLPLVLWGSQVGVSPAAPRAGKAGQRCRPCPVPGDRSGAVAALPWHKPKLFQAARVCRARSSSGASSHLPGVTGDARTPAG